VRKHKVSKFKMREDGGGSCKSRVGTPRPRLVYTFCMADFGKTLLFVAVILFIVGVAFIVLGRNNIPLGRLPGDFVYRGKNTTFYFPLATSIIISVVLSALLYVIARFRR